MLSIVSSFTVQWFKLRSVLDKGFSQPIVVFLVLLSISILSWKILPKKWNRRVNSGVFILSLLYLTLFSPVGAHLMVQGLVNALPPSSEIPADTIVVLGRGGNWADEQVEIAAELWYSNRTSTVFISGTPLEAKILSTRLLEKGIPSKQIIGEDCSRTTEDNARFTTAILSEQQVRRISLITDGPHMLRSLLTFQSFGFQVIPHPVELPDEMSDFRVSKLALREYLALISYASLGRFHERSITDPQASAECFIDFR